MVGPIRKALSLLAKAMRKGKILLLVVSCVALGGAGTYGAFCGKVYFNNQIQAAYNIGYQSAVHEIASIAIQKGGVILTSNEQDGKKKEINLVLTSPNKK